MQRNLTVESFKTFCVVRRRQNLRYVNSALLAGELTCIWPTERACRHRLQFDFLVKLCEQVMLWTVDCVVFRSKLRYSEIENSQLAGIFLFSKGKTLSPDFWCLSGNAALDLASLNLFVVFPYRTIGLAFRLLPL